MPTRSTKNKTRDPKMHSSQKGNEWHFGMKAHIGVDAKADVQWHIAMRPGQEEGARQTKPMDALVDKIEKLRAGIHARAEHPFQGIKRQFGHVKVRHRGLLKSTA